jgi:hypothetical protein
MHAPLRLGKRHTREWEPTERKNKLAACKYAFYLQKYEEKKKNCEN